MSTIGLFRYVSGAASRSKDVARRVANDHQYVSPQTTVRAVDRHHVDHNIVTAATSVHRHDIRCADVDHGTRMVQQ